MRKFAKVSCMQIAYGPNSWNFHLVKSLCSTLIRPHGLLDLLLHFSADSSQIDPPSEKMPFSFYFLLPPPRLCNISGTNQLMVPQKWFTYENE